MEAEQSQLFNERLNQWISSQGFWFQLRHSNAGTSGKNNFGYHFAKLAARVAVVVLLLAAAGTYYMFRQMNSGSFIEKIQDGSKAVLGAEEARVSRFRHDKTEVTIGRFAAAGGDKTFFQTLEARGVRFKMSVLDALKSSWDPGLVTLYSLDMELRAGADSPESSANIAKTLFQNHGKLLWKNMEVRTTNLRWGYSDRTRGEIVDSRLQIVRIDKGYRFTFRGGRFSQNWLHELTIDRLIVVVTPEGIVFEEAKLSSASGSVDLTGLRVHGGERPSVSGTAKINKLQLREALPRSIAGFVEGTFSGEFAVSGSTNTLDGIGLSGTVLLGEDDTITLRDRVHLVRALSIIDFSRNYRRVNYDAGQFDLATSAGGIKLTNIALLSSDDSFNLEGSLTVRPPTLKEQQTPSTAVNSEVSPIFNIEDREYEEAQRSKQVEFSIKSAAMQAERVKKGEESTDSIDLFERLAVDREVRAYEAHMASQLSRELRYEGKITIDLMPDIFERSPVLNQKYPIDREKNRVFIEALISGNIYQITLDQAEQMYLDGRQK